MYRCASVKSKGREGDRERKTTMLRRCVLVIDSVCKERCKYEGGREGGREGERQDALALLKNINTNNDLVRTCEKM